MKDLPTGLQSEILSPDQSPNFVTVSNSLTMELRNWALDSKQRKGPKSFILRL